MARGKLPSTWRDYIVAILKVLHAGPLPLVGAYLFGSAAAGDANEGTSDIDLQATFDGTPDNFKVHMIARSLSHSGLPCPARKLEFVAYDAARVNPFPDDPCWFLNFNTGAGMRDRIVDNPSDESPHWFVLDVAMGRETGVSLYGPPPADMFGAIPRARQLAAMRLGLAWHLDNEPVSANSVLNAARSLRYAIDGRHGSKMEGARWVGARFPEFLMLLQCAERARAGSSDLPEADAHAFQRFVYRALTDLPE